MPAASASIRTPARTGAGGRVGSVRAVQVTASASTSRSTLNFMPFHLPRRASFRTCQSLREVTDVDDGGVALGGSVLDHRQQ
jgi:hypothetical protein